jgi:hypothetical protein
MEKRNSMDKNMRVDTAITSNEGGYVSKMVKLLTLVAVVAVLVAPAILRAQDAPYKLGDEIKTSTVKKTFTIGGNDYDVTLNLKRTVTEEPAMKYYLKEAKEFYTWREGVSVSISSPTDPLDMGYYTIRTFEAPTPTTPATPKAKIYRATPPTEVKTGWRKSIESVRSK